VVSTASYEARPFGVGSALAMSTARRLCPQAIVVPPRMERYAEVSRTVMDVLGRFAPDVEPLSLDEAFADVSGTEALFGPPEALGARLKVAVREATGGLTVSVGLAPTKYVAKVASDLRKPDGLVVVPPDGVTAFLHPLPVARLWGVGPKGVEQLARLSLRTIGDVARADPALLVRRLGGLGAHIAALARGEDPRPVVADRDARGLSSERTLDADVVGAAAIHPVLRQEVDAVARRLRAAGLLAGGVRVKLKTADFRVHTRQCALDPPTDSAHDLQRAADALLPQFDLSRAVRLIGAGAFALRPAAAPQQGALFDAADRARHRQLDRAVDSARARFGDEALRRAADVPPPAEG
jgi:DNA polymerase-4